MYNYFILSIKLTFYMNMYVLYVFTKILIHKYQIIFYYILNNGCGPLNAINASKQIIDQSEEKSLLTNQ